jgi:hypothetical protein
MNTQIFKVLRHPAVKPTIVGLGLFAAGVVTGTLVERGRYVFVEELPDDWNEEPEDDSDPNQFVLALDVDAELARLEEYTEEAQKYLEVHPDADVYTEMVEHREPEDDSDELEDEGELMHHSVFDGRSELDPDSEEEDRDEDSPYIITHEEFAVNEHDFTQITLTYYEGDNLLADDKQQVVFSWDNVVGELKFGHGSNDPNVVYIRNHQLGTEYEVLRHTGKYAEIVHGIHEEDRHERRDSREGRVPKFRQE